MANANKNIGNNIQGAMRAVERGKYGDLTTADKVFITATATSFQVAVQKNAVKIIKPTNKIVIGNKLFWAK